MTVRVLAAALFFMCVGGPANAQAVKPGALSAPAAAVSDPSQRYAVYLPSTYTPGTPAPIMFILDSRGRARVAAEVFVPAAERFGWILMSSSNAVSDETVGPASQSLQAMWADAHTLFAVDGRRVYLAGLSGMARIATLAAHQMPGVFTGVIGAAAGFAPAAPPSSRTRFLYYGTVGDTDYNYWEMRELDDRLAALQLPYRVSYFDGPHAWMPPGHAMAAVEWMELRAMQRGECQSVPALVEAWWTSDMAAAAAFEAAGSPRKALRVLESMVRDYYRLRPPADIAAVAVRRATLSANPAIAAETKRQRSLAQAHTYRVREAMQTIADAFPGGSGTAERSVAQTVRDLGIADLRRDADGSDPVIARAAQRVLAELQVQTGFYLPVEALAAKAYPRAAFYLDIAKAIDPGDSFAWFLRAKLSARSGHGEEAIAALTVAVDGGFRSLELLEDDPAFTHLKARADFQSLLSRVRAAWMVS